MRTISKYTKYIIQLSIVLLIILIIASCNKCNPYVNTPAVFNEFTAESSEVTLNGTGNFNYNVTDKDGITYLEVEADYNGDGSVSDSEKDTINDYVEGTTTKFTTRNLTKTGPLEVKITSFDNLGSSDSAKKTINVVDYLIPSLADMDFTLVEGEVKTATLPAIEGITWTDISVIEGDSKIDNISLDPTTRIVTLGASNNITEQTNYDVRAGYRYSDGRTGTVSKVGNVIKNKCRIQARLEIAKELGVLKPGEIRGYDEADMNNEANYLGRQVTSDGLVDLVMTKPADIISLQGLVTGERSYWAKISLDGKKDYLIENGELTFDDNGNVTNNGKVTLRPNYYPVSRTALEQRHAVNKTNSRTSLAADGKQYGQIRPDLNIEVIEILKKNPYSGVVYTTAQQEAVANVYLNNPDFKKVYGINDLSNLIQIDGEDNTPPIGKIKNFTVAGPYVVPNVRCRVIVPSNAVGTAGTEKWFKNETELSGEVDRVRIELNPSVFAGGNLDAILIHEDLGHGIFAFWTHVPDEYGDDSIVAYLTRLTQYGGVDYAIADAVKNKAFPKRSPLNRTHALTWGAYEEL